MSAENGGKPMSEEDEAKLAVEEREREGRDNAVLRLAMMLFTVSSAGPKPHTPHTAFQQATAFLEEATKKFGEKASRRIF